MYQALYRKWRPQTFNDVVGQQNITATLANEVENQSISHAYLFTGSRGTGKTTCAKILAKAVNCLNPQQGNPCNACELCIGVDSGAIMDIVELDAASNNGVESIRDMIDETVFTPVKAKYRVYIIDEAHMLSTAAGNAFLKTLEEPPEHVIFILATTDPQKLLQTIRSRCQRFDFRRIHPKDIAERLQYIAHEEGFTLDEDAAALIARIADGALRDAISLLDLCAVTSKHISTQTVSSAAGLADKEFLFVLTDCIKAEDTAKALELVNELHASYADMTNLCTEFLNHMRNLMIIKSVKTAETLITCTSADFTRLVEQAGTFTLDEILDAMFLLQETAYNLSKGYNKRTEFELAVIRLCTPEDGKVNDTPASVATKAAPAPVTAATPKTETVPIKQAVSGKKTPPVLSPAAKPEPQEPAQAVQETQTHYEKSEDVNAAKNKTMEDSSSQKTACTPDEGQVTFELWPNVLRLINTKLPSLWAFIRTVSVFVEDDTLILCSEKIEPIEAFINLSTNLATLKLCIFEVTQKNYRIECKKTGTSCDKPIQKVKEDKKDIENRENEEPTGDKAKADAFFDKMKELKF